MKVLIIAVLAILLPAFSSAMKCDNPDIDITKTWIDMGKGCVAEVRKQIQMEINASTIYMAMGAYFSQDTVNRLGFSKIFFESSAEERDHAQQLMGHLLTRGELTTNMASLIKVPSKIEKTAWNSGAEALTDALELEAKVTRSIKNLIKVCDNEEKIKNVSVQEYYLVDFLSGDFLDEQYQGQRKLAGQISTLQKMVTEHNSIGEFLFDKELLK